MAKKKKKAAKKAPAKKATKKKAAKKATAKKAPAKKATKKKAAKKATAKKATKKKAAKKATAKKATKKKAAKKATKKAAKKVTAKAAPAKVAPKRIVGPAKANWDKTKGPRTKSQILNAIADSTGLSKKEVRGCFETLEALIGNDLGKKGQFVLPGLMKLVVKRKPARKARKGVNPFTGEEMMFKAKPASNTVRARPLKNLKEMV